MIDALRPSTAPPPVRPQTDRIAPGHDGPAAPRDAMQLSQGAKPVLLPLPEAVALRLQSLTATTDLEVSTDAAGPTAPLTLENALNPLDRHSVVGVYVNGLAELSGTPAKATRWLLTVGQDLQDPTLTTTDRVVRVREHSQATAKLLYTATALPAVWNTAGTVLPAWLYGGRFAIQASQCHRVLSNVMHVARPVADGVLFIGDAANLKQKLQDPQATDGQTARAALDVGLDTARLVTYALPQTSSVKVVAGVSLLARTGLGIYDMIQKSQD
jgi:hypothetical protein